MQEKIKSPKNKIKRLDASALEVERVKIKRPVEEIKENSNRPSGGHGPN